MLQKSNLLKIINFRKPRSYSNNMLIYSPNTESIEDQSSQNNRKIGLLVYTSLTKNTIISLLSPAPGNNSKNSSQETISKTPFFGYR